MENDFDRWNSQKKQIASESVKRFIRDMYKINEVDWKNILEQIYGFFDKSKPRF